MTTIIRAIAIAFLIVTLSYLTQACRVQAVDQTQDNQQTLTCSTASAEAGGQGCPGTNPITVTCDGEVTKRADMDPFVGTAAHTECVMVSNLMACCYAPGEVPAVLVQR